MIFLRAVKMTITFIVIHFLVFFALSLTKIKRMIEITKTSIIFVIHFFSKKITKIKEITKIRKICGLSISKRNQKRKLAPMKR